MSCGVVSHSRTVTYIIITLIVSWLAFPVLTGSASARANITDYLSTPPNGFEPQGWNTTGTAANLVIKVGGWEPTKVSGNFGIGNGSLDTLGATNNKDVNFTDNYIIGGDISSELWDPGRINPTTTDTNITASSINTTADATERGNESLKNETAGKPASNDTVAPVAADEDKFYHGGYSPKFNATHPIAIGRPVNDLIYEDPFGIAISTYGRLMGLMMPDGSSINMGIRCLGYGY